MSEEKSCHYWTASVIVVPLPVGKIESSIAKGRKMESDKQERSSSRAQLSSAVTPRREPFFLQVKHPVNTNKDSVFFFLLKQVCFSVKSHKHRLSLCLSSRHTNKSIADYPNECFLQLLKI